MMVVKRVQCSVIKNKKKKKKEKVPNYFILPTDEFFTAKTTLLSLTKASPL